MVNVRTDLDLDNILSSAATESYLKFLLSQIRSTNAHSKALAYLVCRALLTRLPGQRQLQVAYDILKNTELSSLHDMDDFLRGAEDVQVVCILLPVTINIDPKVICLVLARPQSRYSSSPQTHETQYSTSFASLLVDYYGVNRSTH